MTDQEIHIAPAAQADCDSIRALLATAGMSSEGLDEHWRTFIVAREGGVIVGCGGAEAFPFAALIRSVIVEPEHRKRGIGRRIVRQLLDRLASRGIREFYLLTTDGEGYFKKRGFKTIDRDEVHPQILGAREMQDAAEDAICMRLVMLA